MLQLAALNSRRQNFFRIPAAIRIERFPQDRLLAQIDLAEDQMHVIALLESDSMLSRQHSPNGDTRFDDLRTCSVHALHDTGLALVEDEQRVQIAVAGMKHVEDHEFVARRNLEHLIHDLGEAGPGNDRIVEVVVGLEIRNCAERGFAGLPQQRPFFGARSKADPTGTVRFADRRDRRCIGIGAFDRSFDLDEQNRSSVKWKARFRPVLHRPDAVRVHHFERGGKHPCADHRSHGVGGFTNGFEIGQQGPHRRWVRHESDRSPCGDAHRSFAADECAAQIESGSVSFEATQHRQFTVGEHNFERKDVRARHPVQQTVGAAGVRPDIAADRTGLLTRRIRRVVEAERNRRLREVEVEHAGLDPSDPVLRVDLEDPVHLRRGDHDRSPDRHGSSGEAGARATRRDRASVPRRDANAGLNLAR